MCFNQFRLYDNIAVKVWNYLFKFYILGSYHFLPGWGPLSSLHRATNSSPLLAYTKKLASPLGPGEKISLSVIQRVVLGEVTHRIGYEYERMWKFEVERRL